MVEWFNPGSNSHPFCAYIHVQEGRIGGGGGGGGNLLHLHAPEVSKHTGLHVHVHVGIKQTEDALDIPIQHSYSFPLHCQGRGREGVGEHYLALRKLYYS